MKTLTMISLTGALAFTAAAPALAEDPAPTTTPSASQQCKTQRTQMGKATFALTYGTNANRRNAFGKCVSKRSAKTEAAGEAAKTNASKQCKAEEAANPAAFRTKYGTGKKGANAHGKCVSSKAKAEEAKEVKTEVSDEVNAAKSCKAQRKADPASFKAKNAFGKCVSTKAKAKADDRDEQEQEQDSTPATQS